MSAPLAEADARADAALVDAVRVHARWQDPAEWVEADGLLLVAGSTRFPGAYLNCAVRTDPALPSDEVLRRARAFFVERQRGFTLITRPSVDEGLEAAVAKDPRFELRSDSPCMRVSSPVPMRAFPDGIRLESLDEAHHVIDMVAVNAQAYALLGMPEAQVQRLFSHPERVLATPTLGCVAYRGAEPVGAALAIRSGDTAGVYWVGTAPGAQRLGLATVCTSWVTNRALADGAIDVTLQASPMGAPVYERMGYREYDRMRWHLQRSEN